MFSVTNTDWNAFPFWTRKVWPTKSGVTIERRDQVLIGFLAFALFILSIFSKRCDSTKGPFFNDLAIKSNFAKAPYLDFFFDFLLSMIKRSLGLCLARVLNPLASWPHGLTGWWRPPPPFDLPWPPPM